MMKLPSWLACSIALCLVSTAAAATPMTLDKEASSIEFVGTKPGDKHEGGFKAFAGKATADFADPSASTLSIEIDASSIWSDNNKLTNHLKSPDFFDVRKYPQIKFESTKVEISGEEMSKAKITGNWTMLGKTLEIEVPVVVKHTETGLDMMAEFKIDRTKWGMTYGQGKVDNEVSVNAKLVMKR
ncbi:MAG: YceI family protein [Planctomycetota bacterium]